MDDNSDLLARLLMGQGHQFPTDRIMNETLIQRPPGNEATVRALLGDQSVMNLVTPFSQDQSMNPSVGLAASLLGGPGRGPMRGPALAAETGGTGGGGNLYVSLLRDAGTDRAAFDAVMNGLRADKSINKEALGQIANEFANTVTKHKNMGEMFNEMTSAFIRRARFQNKIAP